MSENVKIKVIGVGHGGINTVDNMIKNGLTGVEFWVMNADTELLNNSVCENKLQLGKNTTGGLGTGGNAQIGEKTAQEIQEDIKNVLRDSDMVFITAGFGGGTGTGATPVIAQMAKEMGILTVALVTKPFYFEGHKRQQTAEIGIEKLEKSADAIWVIPNDKLLECVGRQVSMAEAFRIVDDTLLKFIQSISNMITIPGMINVELGDIKRIFKNSGLVSTGIGHASGENRAEIAAKSAIESEQLKSSIHNAKRLIINITGNSNMALHEISEVASIISDSVCDDATIVIGAMVDDNMQDEICVTLIATGVDNDN